MVSPTRRGVHGFFFLSRLETCFKAEKAYGSRSTGCKGQGKRDARGCLLLGRGPGPLLPNRPAPAQSKSNACKNDIPRLATKSDDDDDDEDAGSPTKNTTSKKAADTKVKGRKKEGRRKKKSLTS